MKRETICVKKFGVILVLNKSEERSEKRVVLVHTAVFESKKLMCEKNFSKRAKCFCSRAPFKNSFLQLLMVLKFNYYSIRFRVCFDRN